MITCTERRPPNRGLDGRQRSRYGAGVNNTKSSEPVLEPGVKIKDVVGYEGIYSVTDDGRVWSNVRLVGAKDGRKPRQWGGYWLKQTTVRGYPAVCLLDGARKRRTRYIHDLVAETFVGTRPEGQDVDHLDRDRTNNRVDNLRYASRSENLHNGGAKGYGYCKVTGKWEARISHNNKKVSLGRFDTPEEARAAYVAAKQKLGVPNF